MRPIREKKVPQPQDFRERRRTGTQRQDRRKGVDLGGQALGKQVETELRVDNSKHLVHQGQSLMHTVHRAADITWNLVGKELVECDEGLGLATGSVEERCREDVHALDVCARFNDHAALGSFCRKGQGSSSALRSWRRNECIASGARTAIGVAGRLVWQRVSASRRRRVVFVALFSCVVQLPCDGVEQSDKTCFTDPAAEEGIGGKRPEGVVSDLGVRG